MALSDLLGGGVTLHLAARILELPPGGLRLDQRKAADQRMVAHRFINAQVLCLSRRLRVETLRGKPFSVWQAHKVAIARTTDPAPALRRNQSKPGGAKAGIGEDDRWTRRCRQ